MVQVHRSLADRDVVCTNIEHLFYALELCVTSVLVTNILQFGWWRCKQRGGELTHWQRWDAAYFLGAAIPMNLGMPLAVVLIYIGEWGYPDSKMWHSGSWMPNTVHGITLYVFKWRLSFAARSSRAWRHLPDHRCLEGHAATHQDHEEVEEASRQQARRGCCHCIKQRTDAHARALSACTSPRRTMRLRVQPLRLGVGFGVFVSGSSLTTRRHFSPLLPESQGEETRNNGQLQTQLACAIFGTSPCKGTYPLAKVSGFWAWRWVDCSLKCCSVEIAAPALANHHVVGTVSRQRRRANGDLEVFRELSGVRYLTSKHQSDDSLLCCT
eukprot:s1568_g3.t2